MKKNLLTFFMLCLLVGQYATAQTNPAGQGASTTTAPAQAASLAEADKLNEQVIKLYVEGKYAEALPLAARVLEIREQALGPEHQLVTGALINLASVHAGLGKLDEAEKLYRRALGLFEKDGRGESEQSANVNYQLALIRYKKGDYKQTDSLLQKVLVIREKIWGRTIPVWCTHS